MNKQTESVTQHAIDYIDELLKHSPYEDIDVEASELHKLLIVGLASELHHLIFNQDYFIIGTWQAKQWLGNEAFEAIEKIKEYEQDNFGQVSTDFSDAEKVANMLAYILGEELLSESKVLRDNWDNTLDRSLLDAIRCELAESVDTTPNALTL